ncbi:MAG: TonB-dependent receptor [Sphingomonadales bacterium 12-68-11]|nr:MAG: TonB-dependent receptor [Sphingomonadales bacterium 12-68-11]
MKSVRLALLAGASLAFVSPAFAQQSAPPIEQDDADDFHGTIVVTTGGLRQLDVLAGTSVMRGDELQRNLSGQIGEVLAKLPGVSATSFSPGASRPVLRGFQGDRVRVLVDGLGTIDASNTSADHAVTIDPLTAERIEVLRGPAALIYGGSAIGGAVNVIDKRIPRGVPDEPLHIDAFGALDTAYDLREGGASLDAPLGGGLVLHLDGSHRRTDDVDIPGFVIAEALRQDLLADAAEEAEEGHQDEADDLLEAANLRGTLPNSATETTSLGAGLAWFGPSASFGISAGYYDSLYGVPARPGAHHHHEEGEEEEAEEEHGEAPVTIGLEQFRADLRGSVELGGVFERITTRWGYSDYTHTEFEGDEVGTTFAVEGIEGRVELVQRERGGWRGVIGGQYLFRDFAAVGAEAFVPPNTTESFALFTLQEVALDPFELEIGARYERTDVAAEALGAARGFDSLSGALGLSYSPSPGVKFGVNATRTARAPSTEELYADGPHIATQQFEIGDPLLEEETALGLEAYARASVGGVELSASVYRNWFDDFIYLQETGAEEDELPVYQQLQQSADHFGIEASASVPLLEAAGFRWVGEVGGSYVEATLADGTPVPRIPPLGLLGALELQSPRWDARAELEWYAEQDRIAPFETATDGFAFVNLSLAWKPLRGSENLTVMLQANNLFDSEGRRHASFTKDFVPLAGRNVKLTARLSL